MSKQVETGAPLVRRNEEGMTRWNPWEEMNEVRTRMDDLFARAFGYTPLSTMFPAVTVEFEPPVDIHETDDKIVLYANLPGYLPKDILVEVVENTLTIIGERKALVEDEKVVKHRHNGVTNFAKFNVSYVLPMEIDPAKVVATFNNGILQLEMPKTERAKAKVVKIPIK